MEFTGDIRQESWHGGRGRRLLSPPIAYPIQHILDSPWFELLQFAAYVVDKFVAIGTVGSHGGISHEGRFQNHGLWGTGAISGWLSHCVSINEVKEGDQQKRQFQSSDCFRCFASESSR
jgi:hypothetical protein